jgi:hypothetical protein
MILENVTSIIGEISLPLVSFGPPHVQLAVRRLRSTSSSLRALLCLPHGHVHSLALPNALSNILGMVLRRSSRFL